MDQETISKEILAYLEHHPDAADTALGIRLWWLSRQGAPPRQQDVEQALANLVEAGKVVRVDLDPGIELFRRGIVPHE